MMTNDIDVTPGPLELDSNTVCCAECGEWLQRGDIVRNAPVYKCGELEDIEIVHDVCPNR